MKTESGKWIEVEEHQSIARAIISVGETLSAAYPQIEVEQFALMLTADELAQHARECLAYAESLRERNRGKEETRQAGAEGTEEISTQGKADE